MTIPPELGYEESCQAAPNIKFVTYRHSSLAARWIWESVQLSSMVRAFNPSVIFNMGNRGFLRPPAPQATLIQDAHLFYPFSHFGQISPLQRFKFWYHQRHLRATLRRTSLLFCQTEIARNRLGEKFGKDVRIALCENHFSRYAIPPSAKTHVPPILRKCRREFTLFVPARHYPHKNLEVIPAMFRKHRKRLCEVAVVFTVSPGDSPAAARFVANIQSDDLRTNLTAIGELPQPELAAYYTHTDGLLLPTLLESSSGTYIEAMTYRRPIITSNHDFARAACGDSAVYFEPTDIDSICDAVLKVKDDLKLRANMVRLGEQMLDRRTASWDEIGRGVILELERLAERPARESRNGIRIQDA